MRVQSAGSSGTGTGLPEGGDPGDYLVNTAPGEGEWAPPPTPPAPGVTKFSTVYIGDDVSTTTTNIVHNLGTRAIVVQCWDPDTETVRVPTDIQINNDNSIQVSFSTPISSGYGVRIVVIG